MSKEDLVYKSISFNTAGIDDFIKQVTDARIKIFNEGGQEAIDDSWVTYSEYECEVSYTRPMTESEKQAREDANLKAKEMRRKKYEELKKEFESE